MFYIIRPPGGPSRDSRIVQRGDMLRCDIGVTYLSLNADLQEVAYILRENESDVPKGLQDSLVRGNRLQDLLAGEFKGGRSGNAILKAALQRARAEGLNPKIYSHPLGYHGHAAGPRIGLPDMQNGVPGMGDYPLFPDTCWAIELSVGAAIPEWNNQEISMALEQDAAFTTRGIQFLGGRQTRFHLIR